MADLELLVVGFRARQDFVCCKKYITRSTSGLSKHSVIAACECILSKSAYAHVHAVLRAEKESNATLVKLEKPCQVRAFVPLQYKPLKQHISLASKFNQRGLIFGFLCTLLPPGQHDTLGPLFETEDASAIQKRATPSMVLSKTLLLILEEIHQSYLYPLHYSQLPLDRESPYSHMGVCST